MVDVEAGNEKLRARVRRIVGRIGAEAARARLRDANGNVRLAVS